MEKKYLRAKIDNNSPPGVVKYTIKLLSPTKNTEKPRTFELGSQASSDLTFVMKRKQTFPPLGVER